MCLYRSGSWINKNVQKVYLPLPFYIMSWSSFWHMVLPLPLAVSSNLELNLKAIFDPGIFEMPLITNEW